MEGTYTRIQTPVPGDYTFGNMIQSANSVTAVTITKNSGASPGAVSNIRYAGSTTIPQAIGNYAVTFDVAAATGWNAAANLSAGNLEVNNNQTPKADDYTFGNMNQTAGSVIAVTIIKNSGASPGEVSNICYDGSTTIPQEAGTYAVTFDVAAATDWNAAPNLSAGNLTVSPSASNLAEWLQVLKTIAEDDGEYEYKVTKNETLDPQTLDFTDWTGVKITLKADSPVTITCSVNEKARLFTITGVELVLEDDITLSGGGVEVQTSGTFTMNGGEISGGTGGTDFSGGGGGVYVGGGGSFTMNDGKISGNNIIISSISYIYGGGVYVGSNGSFTMNDGEISGNTLKTTAEGGSAHGGGVSVDGSFTMNGGKISGNTTSSIISVIYNSNSYGGGVYVNRYGTFTMKGGEISDNTTDYGGGGVYVYGLYPNSGTFTMKGGKISGNTGGFGGGVCVSNSGIFHMVTGTIYGADEVDTALRNIDKNGGDALYNMTTSGTADYGTFSGDTWTHKGYFVSTNDTIKVANGNLE
jgi:hypothetical protein